MLVRERAIAFAKRSRTGTPDEDTEDEPSEEETKPEPRVRATAKAEDETQPVSMKKEEEAASRETVQELPVIVPPDRTAEPWPDATPQPMKPVEAKKAERSHTETVGMPIVAANLGRPPEMPRTTAPPPLALGDVEDPTHMPGPKDVPGGEPTDRAPAPGRVPPGDSRSLRRGDEFALIYRVGTYVISRFGTVGLRGQWRVVEYPTSAAASHAYAKECSRFVSEGFSDYRE